MRSWSENEKKYRFRAESQPGIRKKTGDFFFDQYYLDTQYLFEYESGLQKEHLGTELLLCSYSFFIRRKISFPITYKGYREKTQS